ncbi:MAG: aminotransferase class V-fold PLP-dependent enzyme [Oscillospiraceae bacterium]|nr:aminotransferase class V-fold PLP-dependent enzyme [Oscillospiraceae bacterium]
MIYLDNCATSYPKPWQIEQAAIYAIRHFSANPGRSGHKLSQDAMEAVYDVREKVGAFFNAEPENVVFTLNCTASLNFAIKGCLRQGDHCIISCFEHNSVYRPIVATGIDYSVATVHPNDADATVKSFESAIKPNTKAIICTHASNVTGDILPIEQIGNLCKKHGLIFIVDGAQTSGVLAIDTKKLGIDFLCLSGHKGLMSLGGVGALVCSNKIMPRTIIEGGTGGASMEKTQPLNLPERLESGTLNTVGICSLGAGIDYLNKIGLDNIHAHEVYICKKFYDALKNEPKIKFYGGDFKNRVGVVSFNIDGIDSAQATQYLSDQGFALRGGFHCSALAHTHLGTHSTGTIRMSPGFRTTDDEIEKFITQIKSML